MLEQQLREAFPQLSNDDFGYHATNLYVVAYPEVDQWLRKNYQWYCNVRKFYSNPNDDWNGAGKTCLSIPFAGKWARLEKRLEMLEQQSGKD